MNSSMLQNISFGLCPVCGQGELIAVINPPTTRILLMCDDCESQWESPETAKSYENALKEEIHPVVEATAEEVRAAGWIK